MSPRAVQRRLHGIPKAERDARIAAEYGAGGRSLGEVAARHGVSPTTVWDICHAAGVMRTDAGLEDGRRWRDPARTADMHERYYIRGETLQAIGDAWGMTREAVRQHIEKTARRLPEGERLRRVIARYILLANEAEAELAALMRPRAPARRGETHERPTR